jgi:hypothetical protein
MGCICRFGFCYLHQNRFLGRSLCCIEDIVFVTAVLVAAVVVAADDLSALDNHVAR